MKFRTLLVTILSLGILCGIASAASVYDPCVASASPPCTFNMSGIITVTGNTITWHSDASGNAANMFTFNNGQNVFSVVPNGSQESIQNLNLATEPVGTTFGPFAFIAFPTNPSLPALNINFIFAGIYSTATCDGTPAVGQTCTPAVPGGGPGPFNFVNNPGTQGPQATATFVFAGVSADSPNANWTANFTSQFNVPFQTVLAALSSAGNVTNSYSATTKVVISVPGVPEPGTMALMTGGIGLIGLSEFLRRKLRRNQQ